MNADPPANLEFFLALTLAPDTAWVIVQGEFEATGVNPSTRGLLAVSRPHGQTVPGQARPTS
jgi:hypothetical protein